MKQHKVAGARKIYSALRNWTQISLSEKERETKLKTDSNEKHKKAWFFVKFLIPFIFKTTHSINMMGYFSLVQSQNYQVKSPERLLESIIYEEPSSGK